MKWNEKKKRSQRNLAKRKFDHVQKIQVYKVIFSRTIHVISNEILIESQVNSFHVLERLHLTTQWCIWLCKKSISHCVILVVTSSSIEIFLVINFKKRKCQKKEREKKINWLMIDIWAKVLWLLHNNLYKFLHKNDRKKSNENCQKKNCHGFAKFLENKL